MARATTRTLIPLDRAAEILGIEPNHFNGVVSDYGVPNRNACDDVWYQYAWQNASKFSREDLAYVLHQAEEEVATELGFYPTPVWIQNEEHEIEGSYRTELYNTRNTIGGLRTIFTRFGYVLEGGIRAKTVIEADAPIVYSDENLDGYDETATVVVPTTVTDKEEIAVYFPGRSADDAWEIRPVSVTILTGVATITFPRSYAVKPALQEKVPSDNDPTMEVDGDVDANFLSLVDVYRVYTDPSVQATFYAGDITYPVTTTGRIGVRDSRRGTVEYAYATWDTTTGSWTSTNCVGGFPYRTTVSYRAGLVNYNSDYPHLRMDPEFERRIVFYATTLADRAMCGCNNFQTHLQYLNTDLAKVEEISYQTTQEILNCPFGTKQAGVDLWRFIKRRKLGASLRKGR